MNVKPLIRAGNGFARPILKQMPAINGKFFKNPKLLKIIESTDLKRGDKIKIINLDSIYRGQITSRRISLCGSKKWGINRCDVSPNGSIGIIQEIVQHLMGNLVFHVSVNNEFLIKLKLSNVERFVE